MASKAARPRFTVEELKDRDFLGRIMVCCILKGYTVLYGGRTDLPSDDWRVDNEQNKFVQELVQEAYTGIQQCPL